MRFEKNKPNRGIKTLDITTHELLRGYYQFITDSTVVVDTLLSFCVLIVLYFSKFYSFFLFYLVIFINKLFRCTSYCHSLTYLDYITVHFNYYNKI